MKKIAILALLICCSITLSAQYDEPTAPDYKSIEKNINNSSSHLNYEVLM